MKLTFLGAGSAFTIGDNNYHSNMILENDRGDRLLIDCGSDVRFSLTEAGYTYRDIHHIYVSHLHGDHVGGLEWLAFSTKFDPSCDRPQLYLCDRLADLLWNKVLSGGLSSIQGQVAQLSTYFHVHPIKENASFFGADSKSIFCKPCTLCQDLHSCQVMACYLKRKKIPY